MKYLLITLLLVEIAHAKILNKIVANVEGNPLTLIEAKRSLQTSKAKRNISPQIYKRSFKNIKDVVDLFIRTQLIRKKLKEIGYLISDDQVESQIKSTETRLGLNRNQLNQFLKENNLTFDEYFETTRESIEYNIFLGRIIRPLVKISENELVEKYKDISKADSITYQYDLVDFYISSKVIKNKPVLSDLKKFKSNGFLPDYLSQIKTNVISEVKEEGLSSEIKKSLRGIKENEFSAPVTLGEDTHYFFVKKKFLIESEYFRKQKPILEQSLFEIKSKKVIKDWVTKQKKNHYIMLDL